MLFIGTGEGIINAKTPSKTTYSTRQSGICKGIVKDIIGETVICALIMIKGSTSGTITGLDSSFTLNDIPRSTILIAPFVGYQIQEVK